MECNGSPRRVNSVVLVPVCSLHYDFLILATFLVELGVAKLQSVTQIADVFFSFYTNMSSRMLRRLSGPVGN